MQRPLRRRLRMARATLVAPPQSSITCLIFMGEPMLTHTEFPSKYDLTTSGGLLGKMVAMGERREKHFLTKQQRREIGERIAASIVNAGKNRAWLAEKLECSPAHVSQFCEDASIGLDRLAHLCILLKVSGDYLLFGDEPPVKPDARMLGQLAKLLEQYKAGQ